MFWAAGTGLLFPGQRGNLVQQQAEGMRRIAAHVIRRAVVSACFQQGAGGAGAAERAQAALAGDLRRGQADIAHLAVHIADGRELDAAVDGREALGGAVDERALDGGGVFDEMHGISFLGGAVQDVNGKLFS